jgi:hypothetical protein
MAGGSIVTDKLINAKVWDGSAWVPAVGGGGAFAEPVEIVTSGIATPIANTSAHTKGAWEELVASTPANVEFLLVEVTSVQSNGANTASLLDLAVGALGSETAIVSNVGVGGAIPTGSAGTNKPLIVPLAVSVPSGSRLSCRIQSVVTGGKTASVSVVGYAERTLTLPTAVDALGASTATSEGANMDGASGTWVEIVASTAQAYRAVTLVPSVHNAVIATQLITYEIGFGASGSEQVIGTWQATTTTAELVRSENGGWPWFATANIPAGSRIAVRHDIATNPARYGVTVIGIP